MTTKMPVLPPFTPFFHTFIMSHPIHFCAANAAVGAKDKVVAGAKAVGETAANIGEGVVNAGKAAGETVGEFTFCCSNYSPPPSSFLLPPSSFLLPPSPFLFIPIFLFYFIFSSATAATNVKDAAVNVASAAGQKVKGAAETVGEGAADVAKGTGNVVGESFRSPSFA
jgi:hypothetical protein